MTCICQHHVMYIFSCSLSPGGGDSKTGIRPGHNRYREVTDLWVDKEYSGPLVMDPDHKGSV